MMMSDPVTHALPDPDRHAEFYSGVAFKRGMAWIVDTIFVTLIVALVALVTALTALFMALGAIVVVGTVVDSLIDDKKDKGFMKVIFNVPILGSFLKAFTRFSPFNVKDK